MYQLNLVQELERKFLPLCESARDAIAAKYPNFQFNVWSSSVGGATPLQGHNLGLEAVFPNAPPEKANTVAIIIGIKQGEDIQMNDNTSSIQKKAFLSAIIILFTLLVLTGILTYFIPSGSYQYEIIDNVHCLVFNLKMQVRVGVLIEISTGNLNLPRNFRTEPS